MLTAIVRSMPASLQTPLLVQRLVEHPARQRLDQLAALRLGHELRRASAARRSGCCQRTSASTPVVRRVARSILRLVVQDELAARDAVAQLAQQRQPARGLVLGLGDEDGEAAAGALGLVHREVGAAQQVGGRRGRAAGRTRCRCSPARRRRGRRSRTAARTPRGSSTRSPRPPRTSVVAGREDRRTRRRRRRATVSESRIAPRRPLGDRSQQRVALSRARASSLTSRNSSRSTTSTPRGSSARSADASARSMRSPNRVRFGSPVRSSCSARCSSASV